MIIVYLVVAAAVGLAIGVHLATWEVSNVQELRSEVEDMKTELEERIAALEEKSSP